VGYFVISLEKQTCKQTPKGVNTKKYELKEEKKRKILKNAKFHPNVNFDFPLVLYHQIKFDFNCNPLPF